MKIAFIMDPLAGVKAWKDTSYLLMLAARQRGHQVYYLDAGDLHLHHDTLLAQVTQVEVHDNHDKPFSVGEREKIDLAMIDAVFVRTDPPFDRRYFYTTLLLDFLPDRVRIVNRPQTLRDWNEKLAALYYPEFSPRTLVSNSITEIGAMMMEHGRLTVKPVDGHGGQGIIFISPADKDWRDKLAVITHEQCQWVVAQEYLAAASGGDKRILLVQGEPIGAILRVHAQGVELNNLDAGGTAHPAELDKADKQICAAIRDDLLEKGVFFCGIDVIGGKLIEINVTSPTGLRELTGFSGQPHHLRIIELLEESG